MEHTKQSRPVIWVWGRCRWEANRSQVSHESCEGIYREVYMLLRGGEHENVFTDKRGSSP